jgi:ABC-type multidrug transport system fused ATPase/permease subunit
MALLRALVTEGEVFYDGVLTTALNLDALRANTTIIPQSVRSLFLLLDS